MRKLYSYSEFHRLHTGNWWAFAIATLAVGPSFALPLFLYFRVKKVEPLADE